MRRGADYDYGDELPIVGGIGVGFQAYPDDLMDESDVEKWRKELDERADKRRPIGFTAVWPEGAPKKVRRKRSTTGRKGT